MSDTIADSYVNIFCNSPFVYFFTFLGFRTQRVKRDTITSTTKTRLYLMNRDSCTVDIFRDDVFLVPNVIFLLDIDSGSRNMLERFK